MDIQQVNFSYTTLESEYFDQIVDFRYKTFFEPFQWDRNMVKDEQEEVSLHLVALKDGNILGYLRITPREDFAEISQMIVDSPYRKKGLGRELLKQAAEKIKSLGFTKVILSSRLNALKFFEKMGFTKVGEVFSNRKTGLLHMKMKKVLE